MAEDVTRNTKTIINKLCLTALAICFQTSSNLSGMSANPSNKRRKLNNKSCLSIQMLLNKDTNDTIRESSINSFYSEGQVDMLEEHFLKAVKNQDLKATAEMLQNAPTPDINTRYHDGKTALMQAAANKDIEMVKLLLKYKIKTYCYDDNKKSVLYYLLRDRDVESNVNLSIIQELIQANKPIIDQHITGIQKTPLLYAIENNKWKLARLLIKLGANVNKTCGSSYRKLITPLILLSKLKPEGFEDAEYNEIVETAQLLINNGANLIARDGEGKTIIDYARENKSKDLEFLFQDAINHSLPNLTNFIFNSFSNTNQRTNLAPITDYK